MTRSPSRRQFLRTASVGATALTLNAVSYSRVFGANDRLSIGVIGCGGRGRRAHMTGVHAHAESQNCEIVAVADPWKQRREEAANQAKEWYGGTPRAVVSYRDILANMEPPNYVWLGAFDAVQRDIPEMEDYLVQAGLDVEDIWMERRVRHTTVEAYTQRMRVVASHLIGDMPEDEAEAYLAEVERRMREASGPRGWTYDFTKLYAIARKPG